MSTPIKPLHQLLDELEKEYSIRYLIEDLRARGIASLDPLNASDMLAFLLNEADLNEEVIEEDRPCSSEHELRYYQSVARMRGVAIQMLLMGITPSLIDWHAKERGDAAHG